MVVEISRSFSPKKIKTSNDNEVLHSDGVDSQYFTTEDSSVPPELLQLLKRSTFTRPEIDRLTKLLESKALDLPVPNIVMEHRKQEQCFKDSSFENWRGSDQSHAVISSKSSEHAAKVKVVESNPVADRQRTPFKLTEDMLPGKALKSLESLDSLIPLQTTLDGGNLEESLRDVACTSRTQNEAKENVPEKSHLQLEVTSQAQNGVEVNGLWLRKVLSST